MAMDVEGTLVGVGVGLMDQYLENKDTGAGRVDTMKQYATYLELAAVVLGNFGDKIPFVNEYTRYTRPMAPAGGAILGKKLYQAWRSTTPTSSQSMAMRQASMAASQAWARRGVAEKMQPGFENVSL